MNFWDGWPTDRILILFSALAFALISVQVGLFHYRGNFRHRVMWGPVLSAPLLALICPGPGAVELLLAADSLRGFSSG